MSSDISVAGYVLTAEEWEELDARARAELVAIAQRRDEPWLVRSARGLLADRSAGHDTTAA